MFVGSSGVSIYNHPTSQIEYGMFKHIQSHSHSSDDDWNGIFYLLQDENICICISGIILYICICVASTRWCGYGMPEKKCNTNVKILINHQFLGYPIVRRTTYWRVENSKYIPVSTDRISKGNCLYQTDWNYVEATSKYPWTLESGKVGPPSSDEQTARWKKKEDFKPPTGSAQPKTSTELTDAGVRNWGMLYSQADWCPLFCCCNI